MMRNKTLNNQGVALVTVVLFFLVLVILLGGVMFSSISNQGNAMLSKEHSSSYYVAESGMNISMEKLIQFLEINNYDNISPGQYSTKIDLLKAYIAGLNGQSGTMSSGTYVISASNPSANNFTMQSTGTVNGVSRTVETTFEITPILEDQAKAIIAKGTIDAKNGSIEGPIASLLDPPGSDITITCNPSGTTDISEIYYPQPLPAGSTVSVDGSCDGAKVVQDIDIEVIFNAFSLPTYYSKTETVVVGGVTKNVLVQVTPVGGVYTFPALTEGQVGYYINSLPSSNVTFDLGSGSTTAEYLLFVDDVQASNSSELGVGDINVIGNGKLKMFMTIDANDFDKNNSVTFVWDGNVNASQINVENTDISKFQLIIRKGLGFDADEYPIFSIANSNIFVGSLMMDYIDIVFGNFNYKGFIATLGENITISSTAEITGPMWIYAPFADVVLTANTAINGSLIANSVSFDSGASLEYLQYTGPLPPELSLPLFLGGEPVPVGITFKFINFKEV